MAEIYAKRAELRKRGGLTDGRDPAKSTYTKADFKRIGAAIGKDAVEVEKYRNRLESAAWLYRFESFESREKQKPARVAPSTLKRKLEQIANSARKLLNALAILDVRDAPDGPGDPAILDVLASAQDGTDDRVSTATARVGRLTEILDSIDAARELEQRALDGFLDVDRIADLTVTPGHRGNDVVNDWIESMMTLYRDLTGKDPKTSVGGPESANAGKAIGPLIRFLKAVGKPLGLASKPDAWRGRVRTILKGTNLQN